MGVDKRSREVTGIWLRRIVKNAPELLIEFDGKWHAVRILSGDPDYSNWPASEIIEMAESNFKLDPVTAKDTP